MGFSPWLQRILRLSQDCCGMLMQQQIMLIYPLRGRRYYQSSPQFSSLLQRFFCQYNLLSTVEMITTLYMFKSNQFQLYFPKDDDCQQDHEIIFNISIDSSLSGNQQLGTSYSAPFLLYQPTVLLNFRALFCNQQRAQVVENQSSLIDQQST